MFKHDPQEWASTVFQACELGDPRRTARLKRVGARMAERADESIPGALGQNQAELEGGYRFIENHFVDPKAIIVGGTQATINSISEYTVLLAPEDTTTLSYGHQLRGGGDLGGPSSSKNRGVWVHSIILVNPVNGETVGLAGQRWWTRKPEERGKATKRQKRPYKEKESYRWEQSSRELWERMGADGERVISVCDREADIYEYLSYKIESKQRFIVRASSDRMLMDSPVLLNSEVDSWWPSYEGTVNLSQRGGTHGRRKREAIMTVSAGNVALKPPKNGADRSGLKSIELNVIQAVEENPPENESPLHWRIYTSEPVDTQEQIEFVLNAYRLRWRIEDFHKSWKSGAKVEQLRLRTMDNMLRAAAILAFVAVRLLQLREISERTPETPCSIVFAEDEWQCLWALTEESPLPDNIPSCKWASEAIVNLAGSYKSKNKSRPGWQKYWKGWNRFQTAMLGWRAMKSLKNFWPKDSCLRGEVAAKRSEGGGFQQPNCF